MSKGALSYVDPDLVVQEAMYGFIMALTLILTAYLGIVHYDSSSNLILAIVGMDFVWGAIDMCIFYRGDIMGRSRRIHTYAGMLNLDDREKKIAFLKDEFEDTIFEYASEADRRKMLEVFIDGTFAGVRNVRNSNKHYFVNSFAALVTSMLTVIPSVLCIAMLKDFSDALIGSAVLSSIALFFTSYLLATNLHRSARILFSISTAAISLLFTVFAAYFGG